MELTERRTGKAVIVAPAGRIDMATAEPLKERLIPLVTEAAKKGEAVVLDFSAVDYISSAGLVNSVNHGYGGEYDQPVWLTVCGDRNVIELRVP